MVAARASVVQVAACRFRPEIGWRDSWHQVSDAAKALADRQVLGKAILDID